MRLNEIIQSVNAFLSQIHINVKQDWLQECVEYLHAIHNDLNTINILTKEQWLLNDLKEVSLGCLPPNLKAQTKIDLKENYVLQIISEIDIGMSAYQQYNKLKNVNNENVEATIRTEDKISNHRMLKFCLTDGVQEVVGIEYQTINKIKTDLLPGSKIRVKGPVVCRCGVIFLTDSTIELMGGEIKEISTRSSKMATLASKLGLSNAQPTVENQNIAAEQIMDFDEDLIPDEPHETRQTTLSTEAFPCIELEQDIHTHNIATVSGSPFVYIKQINDLNDNDRLGKVCKVKAQILHLLKRPAFAKDSWTVECKITDGTGCLNVVVATDLFSELISHTPQQMVELGLKRQTDPGAKERIDKEFVKYLSEAKRKLESIYCIMELKMSQPPIITQFIPFTEQHVMLLQRRLQGF